MRIDEITSPAGIYVGLKVHPEDAKFLHDFAVEKGVNQPIPPDLMHVTLIRTASPKISPGVFKPLGTINVQATVTKYEKHSQYLTLALDFPWLDARRAYIKKEYQLKKVGWPPHITLSDKQTIRMIHLPELIGKTIRFGEEYANKFVQYWTY